LNFDLRWKYEDIDAANIEIAELKSKK